MHIIPVIDGVTGNMRNSSLISKPVPSHWIKQFSDYWFSVRKQMQVRHNVNPNALQRRFPLNMGVCKLCNDDEHDPRLHIDLKSSPNLSALLSAGGGFSSAWAPSLPARSPPRLLPWWSSCDDHQIKCKSNLWRPGKRLMSSPTMASTMSSTSCW